MNAAPGILQPEKHLIISLTQLILIKIIVIVHVSLFCITLCISVLTEVRS